MGSNASYTLNNTNGEISFTPQDTGMFFLAYTVQEYRDGQLLGDMMNYRLAYVVDTTVTLPIVSNYFDLNAGVANNVAAQTITVCPGQLLTYKVKATSQLSNAKIKLSTNANVSVPTMITSISGQGTDSATITYAWIPLPADVGTHYIYTDAVDTACGPGHFPVHQSKGVIVKVLGQLSATASPSVSCAGSSVTLKAHGGWYYHWSVLPGGDPYLPCSTCSELKVHPSVTTTYVVKGMSETCGTKYDTITVRNIPNYTVSAGPDTAFAGAIPPGYTLQASVAPLANYYLYAWLPAGKVTNAAIPNPKPSNTADYNVYVVTVTDSFGCFTRSDTVVVKANAAGITTIHPGTHFSIRPNPVSGAFRVEATTAGTLTITSIEGRRIAEYRVRAKSNQFTLPQGSGAGLYIASFRSDDSAVVDRVTFVYRP